MSAFLYFFPPLGGLFRAPLGWARSPGGRAGDQVLDRLQMLCQAHFDDEGPLLPRGILRHLGKQMDT